MPMQIFLGCLFAVNLLAFLIAAWDKHMAKTDGWRVPEKVLLSLAVVGGAAGLLLAMKTVRHKTRKPLFKYGVPFILLVQLGILYLLFKQDIFFV